MGRNLKRVKASCFVLVKMKLLNLGSKQPESCEHQARSSAKQSGFKRRKPPFQFSNATINIGFPCLYIGKRLNEICDKTGEYQHARCFEITIIVVPLL